MAHLVMDALELLVTIVTEAEATPFLHLSLGQTLDRAASMVTGAGASGVVLGVGMVRHGGSAGSRPWP
jgi:hypothetical protein